MSAEIPQVVPGSKLCRSRCLLHFLRSGKQNGFVVLNARNTGEDETETVSRSRPAEIGEIHSGLTLVVLLQIPGLIVWTSALPESTGFLRLKCYSLRAYVLAGVLNHATFNQECGPDLLHAGKPVLTKAIQMLMAELCSEYLDLSSVEDGSENKTVHPPVCCSDR